MNRRTFVTRSAVSLTAVLLPARATLAHELPALPYRFDALEPHIDARTMEIHHDRHHAGYVDKLNAALGSSSSLADKPLESVLSDLGSISDESIRTAVRNNGGGHWNHAFFWETLAPEGSAGKPSDDLSAAINAAFGSMDQFKEAFAAAAGSRFGSGWAWLIAREGKLAITSTPNQDNPFMKGLVPDSDLGTPVLGLDVWEHAYYLKYQNKRPDYVAAWWNVVNWNKASERFAAL